MKRFLYYNQDSVDSLLAQIEQGLLVKTNAGEEVTNSETNTTEFGADIVGDLGGKFLGIGASIKGGIKADSINSDAASKLIKNIHEKVLHDYSFDRVYNYFAEKGLIRNENPSIGDIVSINEVPTFLDFDYLKGLFADDGAMKMTNDKNKKELKDNVDMLKKDIPKGKQIPFHIQKQIDDLTSSVNTAESERKDTLKTIEVVQKTLPYNRFIMTQNMLIPIDDEYLRDKPEIVAFKYGGEMSIFGYVTNIITLDEPLKRNNDFFSLYDTVNKVMLGMFKGENKIYIVHPVAIFY